MAFISSVPKIEFTEAGLIIPTEASILSGVQTDIDAAFGGGLNPALETPQGQLASSETAIIGDKNNEFAYYVNQIDPQYASGRFQDAIARIYFLNRKPGTSTAVVCTLSGLPGTIIPVGTLAQDTNSNIYSCSAIVTIGQSGNVDVEFQNILDGPIPCSSGTLTRVYRAIPGWDTITNADDGTTGSLVESRADFEYRRRNSVALNGHGSAPSIYAAVFDLDDVIDVYVIDNPLDTTVLTGTTDYPIVAHSVYVAVVGGEDAEIANAIWLKKDLGCNYNGNTTVIVTDTSGYNYPQPTYNVTFERPTALPILFEVQIVDSTQLPSDITDQVKAAIIARFNGADGSSRERIGSLVLASRYYGPIVALDSNASVISILIGIVTPDDTEVEVGIDQRPTINADDISVVLV